MVNVTSNVCEGKELVLGQVRQPSSDAAQAAVAWSGRQSRPQGCIMVGWSRLVVRGRRGNMLLVELELKHMSASQHRYPLYHSDPIWLTATFFGAIILHLGKQIVGSDKKTE